MAGSRTALLTVVIIQGEVQRLELGHANYQRDEHSIMAGEIMQRGKNKYLDMLSLSKPSPDPDTVLESV